jgi:hypothetical protein
MNTTLDTILDNLAADGRASADRNKLIAYSDEIRKWASSEGVMVKFDWHRVWHTTARVYLRKAAR